MITAKKASLRGRIIAAMRDAAAVAYPFGTDSVTVAAWSSWGLKAKK
jgi:hypothetical protein